ncbi:hypothetical protein ACFO1B_10170 [Dactylosporangium siamense]|uniref:Uncharacterized protein n=1 Tax=Dactylosporangium siamense TaxID=685454 RepID=A0A919UBD8_9ACTN|nr:hypothetical protein [Dactylosporangium siamense]GIG49062.1 hypothetical protein Dsi01nite_071030 [Dactylosporangium siamense]
MGALGLHIGLSAAPAAGDELLREVWDVIADRMSRLADTPASEEILAYYLAFQASDGFADGTWSASGTSLLFTFGDAAGLCPVEMYACQHWATLTVLDRWTDLAALAAKHGTTLAAGSAMERALRANLTGPSDRVFFHHFTDPEHERLGYATATPTPGDDHELRFYALDEAVRPLSQTGDDRPRLTELITTGTCACDICQNLRFFRDLPRARHQFE